MVKVASGKAKAISLEEKYDEPQARVEFEEAEEQVEYKLPDFRLTKYIKVFDDALPPNYCDKIVKTFREDGDNHIVRNGEGEKFVSCNIEKSAAWATISEAQRKIVEASLPVYAKSVEAHQNCFPKQSTLEDFYIYQFRDKDDVREVNVDITHYGQAKRYLTFMWFLTDDENFQIGFFDVQNTVSAKKGRLIIFPSTWTYPYSIANFGEGKENFLMKTHLTML